MAGNFSPYSAQNSLVVSALSCEIPKRLKFAPPYVSYKRSRNGIVNWHVGQLALKNAASTGPFFRASASEICLPPVLESEISGAISPAGSALILLQPSTSRI